MATKTTVLVPVVVAKAISDVLVEAGVRDIAVDTARGLVSEVALRFTLPSAVGGRGLEARRTWLTAICAAAAYASGGLARNEAIEWAQPEMTEVPRGN